MDHETDIKPEGRKQSVLGIILIAFVGLVGLGLIGLGGFAWFIVSEVARVHGGNAGGLSVFFLAISAAGAALLASAIWKAFSTERINRC